MIDLGNLFGDPRHEASASVPPPLLLSSFMLYYTLLLHVVFSVAGTVLAEQKREAIGG